MPFTSYNRKVLATRIFKINMNLKSLDSLCLLGSRQQEQRDPNYRYYYLACPCNLACGCYNRTRAWPLPIQRCYSMEMLDRACRERLLQQIGYEIIWHCKECDLPSSCGAYHDQIHVQNVILYLNNGDLTHK